MWISDFSWFVNLLTIIIKVCNLCNVITSVLYSKRPEHYFLIKKSVYYIRLITVITYRVLKTSLPAKSVKASISNDLIKLLLRSKVTRSVIFGNFGKKISLLSANFNVCKLFSWVKDRGSIYVMLLSLKSLKIYKTFIDFWVCTDENQLQNDINDMFFISTKLNEESL